MSKTMINLSWAGIVLALAFMLVTTYLAYMEVIHCLGEDHPAACYIALGDK